MTAVAGSVFTAAQFNQFVRDNLNETGPALVTGAGQTLVSDGANSLVARTPTTASTVATVTTASTSYVALAGGPAVTVTTGTQAFVGLYAAITNTVAADVGLASFAISGATSVAAADTTAVTANGNQQGAVFLITGLTPGSNVFTMQYRANAGTASFFDRNIWVSPL